MEKKILFISNGYGEDVVSAHLAEEFRKRRPDDAVLGLSLIHI